eukprot:3022564-Prymnesium_polylepis.1
MQSCRGAPADSSIRNARWILEAVRASLCSRKNSSSSAELPFTTLPRLNEPRASRARGTEPPTSLLRRTGCRLPGVLHDPKYSVAARAIPLAHPPGLDPDPPGWPHEPHLGSGSRFASTGGRWWSPSEAPAP